MTPAHRVEHVLLEDGKLQLEQLPFRAGQVVEILIVAGGGRSASPHSLRGSVVQYDQPTDPVADADWASP